MLLSFCYFWPNALQLYSCVHVVDVTLFYRVAQKRQLTTVILKDATTRLP